MKHRRSLQDHNCGRHFKDQKVSAGIRMAYWICSEPETIWTIQKPQLFSRHEATIPSRSLTSMLHQFHLCYFKTHCLLTDHFAVHAGYVLLASACLKSVQAPCMKAFSTLDKNLLFIESFCYQGYTILLGSQF